MLVERAFRKAAGGTARRKDVMTGGIPSNRRTTDERLTIVYSINYIPDRHREIVAGTGWGRHYRIAVWFRIYGWPQAILISLYYCNGLRKNVRGTNSKEGGTEWLAVVLR